MRLFHFLPVRVLAGMGLFLVLLACESEEKPPQNIIPEKKMAAILADVHLAEARVSRMQLQSLDSSTMVFNQLQNQIWKKHQVDTLRYKESYAFYTTHPSYMTRIYEQVLKNIEAREKKNNIKL
ncbi:DUF4296 domain-containing protein [Telluribacter sp.]|jgi:hypothetical protein|uniref:DUF4296 domain-containing protein n=1 Tax=Telluribacter sp. TaxID=1978767 RepID=UPI002E139950|nr:DUF4296 domain-containing protein [Telluribacter sp.]